MKLLESITDYANKNDDKLIAMFVDMDGVIANLEIDINNSIAANTPGFFLNKRPMRPVIDMLNSVSKISNVDLYILSACGYKNQAEEKREWLETYAPFFKKEKQIFVIKEIVNYTRETKSEIKVKNIINTMENKGYDLAIYFEDEYQMLKTAYRLLKDKILCIHISNFID